jgi:hypothetical protein
MVYLGVGGEIDGKINPVLSAAEGQAVQVTIINGEGAEHDVAFSDQDARSPPARAPARPLLSGRPRSATSPISAPCPAIVWPAWKASSW